LTELSLDEKSEAGNLGGLREEWVFLTVFSLDEEWGGGLPLATLGDVCVGVFFLLTEIEL
jgi:hypothetical protein